MESEIRELTINDYDEIIRIWAISGLPYKPKGRDSKEMMTKEMALEICQYFGLYQNDTLVGVAIANYDGRRGWINRVAVDPDYRSQGFAGRLITRCSEFLESSGAVVLCALIEDMNYPSISTFGKEGFTHFKEIAYFTKRHSDDA